MLYAMPLIQEVKAMPNPNDLISIENLVTTIEGKQVVNSVSFTIAKGETLALVGESGSGKSITALSIMRLLPASAQITAGTVSFQDTNLLHMTEAEMRTIRGRRIGIIFQEPMTSLNPVMTISQQISEAISNSKPDSSQRERLAEVIELLELVGIKNPEQRINEYPHQFSGGMRQRVMIAIALACEPDLLIADEPTTALDVTIQAQVLDLIKEIQKKRRMAVLLITHDLGVVHDFADRIAVMRHGEILEISHAATFFSTPKHDYSQGLFDAIPSLNKRGKKLSSANLQQHSISATEQGIFSLNNDGKYIDTTDVKTDAKPLLEVKNLKTYFPIKKGLFKRTYDYVKAVDDISLNIQEGRTLALVGESGSGKTTLAKTIIGLLKASSGEINNYENKTSARFKKRNYNTQIIFQDPYSSMNPRMLIRDILSEGMKALKIFTAADALEKRMLELLHLVGLDKDSLNRYPHQFSGGQRQRIAIARALALNPTLIICDEPTSALDVSVQAQILNLLQELQEKLGLSYLFITHDISVVSYIADEVAVMLNGKIVETGETENIILRPKHQYTKTLMSAVPSLYKKY